MSNPIQSMPTATGEFQAHFGGSPGSSDLAAECKKWEKLCGELLADRQKLREELDACRRTLLRFHCENYQPDFDAQAALAHIDDEPSLEQLIAELRSAPE